MPRRRLIGGLILAAVVLYLAATVSRAAHRHFWYDELFTVYVVDIGDPSRIWTALRAGVDLNPPLLYAATWIGRLIAGNNEVGNRLPAIAGFLLFLYCTGRFVSRRAGSLAGLLAAALLALSGAYTYSLEARSYGMLMGWSSMALLCWQSAAGAEAGSRKRALAGLAISAAAALLTHCYALVALAPLAFGEGFRTIQRRRIDAGIAASLALAAPAILVYFPLLRSSRGYQLKGPIFDPVPVRLAATYFELILPALPAAAVILAIALLCLKFRKPDAPGPAGSFPAHEAAAVVGLALSPAIAFALAIGMKGGYFTRYGLGAAAGFAIAAAWMCSRILPRTPAVLPLLAVAWFGARFLIEPAGFPIAAEAEALARTDPKSPVVITDGQTFLELNHYADPATAARLVFLTDRPAALRHMQTDCYDRIMPILQPWFPIRGRVVSASSFLAAREPFLIYGANSRKHTWLPQQLESLSISMVPRWTAPSRTLSAVGWDRSALKLNNHSLPLGRLGSGQ